MPPKEVYMNVLGAILAIIILVVCSYEPKSKPEPLVCCSDFIYWLGDSYVLPTVQKLGRLENSFLEYPNEIYDVLPTHIANVQQTPSSLSIPYTITLRQSNLTNEEIAEKLTHAFRRYVAKKCALDVRHPSIKGISVRVISLPNTMDADVILSLDSNAYSLFAEVWNNSRNVVTY